ncbi:MAG TPA: MMPL family transporter [Streptosporangiaceae bacterium]|nr:MMPL family transporter [Streptosporangiaceae bacterium]
MRSTGRLTGAAGRWSASHPWIAIGAWVGCVVILLVTGHLAGTRQLLSAQESVGQSGQAEQMISRDFAQHANESVLFDSARLGVGSPAYQAAIRDVLARIEATGRVTQVRSPLVPAFSNQISPDRHAALLQFEITGSLSNSASTVVPVLAAVHAAAAAHPLIQIAETGDATIAKAVNDTVMRDLHRAELLSFPITMVVLLIAFGAIVAAVLPLGLATMAILAATGLVAFTSHLSGVTVQANSVMLLIGLAVGVDYSMFYVKRQREERAAGRSVLAAIEVAAATSGRSVLISGLTVLLAMSGMFLTGSAIFYGIGQATMLVVAVAVVGSLTLLPALLALLGDRVGWGRLHLVRRQRRPAAQGRVWDAIIDRVLAHPARAAGLAAGILIVLAVPVLRLHTATPGASDLPQNTAALETYNRIQQVFPGGSAPAIVVVEAHDVTAPSVLAAGLAFERAALASGQMHQPIAVIANPARTAAIVQVPLSGTGENATSSRALATLRDKIIPETLGRVPGVRVEVGGLTAGTVDFNNLMRQRSGWVFAFVLSLAFVLLLVSFRSIVIPMTAVVLNSLSVAAAYGVIVALFQWGWGQSALGFTSEHSVASWLPLFLFVVLFGLSMDYHVFILSRIRESYDREHRTDQAVAHGTKATAGVVTAAAVVMVFVFLTFATLSMVSLKEMGVGLAVAVLLDATLVRAVLLPATMKLLGPRNWYLPRWLGWLPQISAVTPPPSVPEQPEHSVLGLR